MSPTRLMEELAYDAAISRSIGPGGDFATRALQRAREQGKEPPDWALPGRFIMRLKPEEREILSRLGSNMLQNVRPSYIELLVT